MLNDEDKKIECEKYIKPDFPYSIGISLGEWQCNRACRMCPMYTQKIETPRYMTDEVFQRACESIGDREVSLEISAYGEPFQHPKADKFLMDGRKFCKNARIVWVTNGSLLYEERCEKIVDSGIDVLQFSLDAGSAETYKWLTGSSAYEKVCRNLETLAEIKQKRGADHLYIQTHIIGVKEMFHEFKGFIERWKDIVDGVYVREFGNWAGLVNENNVTPIHVNSKGDLMDEDHSLPERYPCAWLWYATKIEPNGDVSKCFVHITGEKKPVGNIMEKSLAEIWQDDNLSLYRDLHCSDRYDELEYCEKCIVWSLFPHLWKRVDGKWQY